MTLRAVICSIIVSSLLRWTHGEYSLIGKGGNDSSLEKCSLDGCRSDGNDILDGYAIRASKDNDTGDASLQDEYSWFAISRFPLLPIVFAESPYLPDGPCKRQVHRYLRELRRGTIWASKMYDASAKHPESVLVGSNIHGGNFDECYNLNVDIPSDVDGIDIEHINGRYCTAMIEYHRKDAPITGLTPDNADLDPNESVWQLLRERANFIKRNILKMGLCVPSTCSSADVENALRAPLRKIGWQMNLTVRVTVPSIHCQTPKESLHYPLAAKIYCAVVLGIVSLILASTWYDNKVSAAKENTKSAMVDLLFCFSARRNLKSLLDVSYVHPGFDVIHLIRVVFTCSIICIHRGLSYLVIPVRNTYYIEGVYNGVMALIFITLTLPVDGFFTFAAMLHAYATLNELNKRKQINFLSNIVMRYLRLTPAYLMVALFFGYVFVSTGSGPAWKWFIERECRDCARNWWANMLYIHNYLPGNPYCMLHTWSISVDMHGYVIALFLLYIFWHLPRYLGYFLLAICVLVSSIIRYIAAYVNEVPPVFVDFLSVEHVKDCSYFVDDYIKTHVRLTPYFIGIIAGAIIYDCRHSEWKLSKKWSRASFAGCLMLCILTIAFPVRYTNPDNRKHSVETAVFQTLYRSTFSFSLAGMVILFTLGEGLDDIRNFLSPRWAQPLAKLSYAAFLSHIMKQLYDSTAASRSIELSAQNYSQNLILDMFYTFWMSLFIVLAFELPFRNIAKRFVGGKAIVAAPHTNGDATSKKTS